MHVTHDAAVESATIYQVQPAMQIVVDSAARTASAKSRRGIDMLGRRSLLCLWHSRLGLAVSADASILLARGLPDGLRHA